MIRSLPYRVAADSIYCDPAGKRTNQVITETGST